MASEEGKSLILVSLMEAEVTFHGPWTEVGCLCRILKEITNGKRLHNGNNPTFFPALQLAESV